MLWRFVLACFSLIAMRGPGMAHQIGLAEQVLQPVTVLQSLLALIAVGLLCRQQPTLLLNRALALMLGLGLTAGLAAAVYFTLVPWPIDLMPSSSRPSLAAWLLSPTHYPRVCHFPLRSGPRHCHRREPFIGNDRLGRFDPNAGGGVPGDPRRASFPDDGRNSVHRQLAADRRARCRLMDLSDRYYGSCIERSQPHVTGLRHVWSLHPEIPSEPTWPQDR